MIINNNNLLIYKKTNNNKPLSARQASQLTIRAQKNKDKQKLEKLKNIIIPEKITKLIKQSADKGLTSISLPKENWVTVDIIDCLEKIYGYKIWVSEFNQDIGISWKHINNKLREE